MLKMELSGGQRGAWELGSQSVTYGSNFLLIDIILECMCECTMMCANHVMEIG